MKPSAFSWFSNVGATGKVEATINFIFQRNILAAIVYFFLTHGIVYSQTCAVEAPFPDLSPMLEQDLPVSPVPTLAPPNTEGAAPLVPVLKTPPLIKFDRELPLSEKIMLVSGEESPAVTNKSGASRDYETIPPPLPLENDRKRLFQRRNSTTANDDLWLNINEDSISSSRNATRPRVPTEIDWNSTDETGQDNEYSGVYDQYETYGSLGYGHLGMYEQTGELGGNYPFGSPYFSSLFDNITFSIGTAGFQNPVDYGSGGFGVSESINWNTPVLFSSPIRLQAGIRGIQSKLCGYEIPRTNIYHRSTREQYFGTLGVFYRGTHHPIQLGVAYDLLEDKYDQKFNLEQMRAELSYISPYGYEFGFRGAFGLKNDLVTRNIYHLSYDNIEDRWHADWRTVTHLVAPSDYYSLFIKKYYGNGGEGTLGAGATDYGDVLARADFTLPLTDYVSLQSSFSYIIPSEGRGPLGTVKESWNAMLQLTFQPRGGLLAGFCDPYRAMFDIADNGTFIPAFR